MDAPGLSLLTYDPDQLKDYWCRKLHLAKKGRPKSINDDVPESVKAFKGEYWKDDEDKPEMPATANLVYAAWKSYVPQMLSKPPTPAAKARNKEYDGLARLVNRFKEYRDKELHLILHCRKALQDAFLRGTGCIRQDRDISRGMARTQYFPITSLYIDHNATCLQDAKYIIEKHQVYRWEAVEIFGEVANELPADRGDGNKSDSSKAFDDRVTYHLAWSKHVTPRVFAFHEEWSDAHLTETEEGPGEPFPYVFDEEDWHIKLLTFNNIADSPWGFGYYEVARSPIRFLNYMLSYVLAAAKSSTTQTVVYPKHLGQLAQDLANNKQHLNFFGYDADDNDIRPIQQQIEVLQYPPLAPAAFQGIDLANQIHEQVTAFSQIAQGAAASVETASEAVRQSEYAEVRVADDQLTVEKWMEDIWAGEIMIDGKFTPTRSVLLIGEENEVPEGPTPSESNQKGAILTDIPYKVAVLLERGVGDIESAMEVAAQIPQYRAELQQFQVAQQQYAAQQQQFQASQAQAEQQGVPFQGRMPPPPEEPQNPDPDGTVTARFDNQIPMDESVRIIEPGIECFVGEELAQFWIENLSDRELRSQVELRVQSGSLRRLGHLQEWNEALQLFQAIGGVLVEWGFIEQFAELYNFIVASMDKVCLDRLMVTPQMWAERKQEMDAIAQQQMQQEQQMEERKFQLQVQTEEQIQRVKLHAATEREKIRADRDRSQGVLELAKRIG